MSCKKCNTPLGKCGCKDTAFTTPFQPSCPPNLDCPTPSVCSEYVDTQCVYATFGIKNFFINKQDSLMQILQKLDIFTNGDATCLDPDSTCNSTTLVYPTVITETSISVSWLPVTTATVTGYYVYYKQESAAVYTFLPVQTTTAAIITNLVSNTNYNIYIRTDNTVDGCFCDSSIITVKTLAS